MPQKKELYWKVHVPNLFAEIIYGNDTTWIFRRPLQVLLNILAQVAERAAELDDPKLLLLLSRLTLYEVSDPSHKNYDPDLFNKLEELIKESEK